MDRITLLIWSVLRYARSGSNLYGVALSTRVSFGVYPLLLKLLICKSLSLSVVLSACWIVSLRVESLAGWLFVTRFQIGLRVQYCDISFPTIGSSYLNSLKFIQINSLSSLRFYCAFYLDCMVILNVHVTPSEFGFQLSTWQISSVTRQASEQSASVRKV